MWDNGKEHERKVEWLRELRAEKDKMKQNEVNITTEMIKEQVKKISNWKSPEKDVIQGYWPEKLTTLHEHLAKQMDDIISNRKDIPKWMALGKTVLVKEMLFIITDQYCAFMMTRSIAESIYNFLDVSYKLPVEQK